MARFSGQSGQGVGFMPHMQNHCAPLRDRGQPFALGRILGCCNTCCEEVARSAGLHPLVASRSGGEAGTIAERRAHHGGSASYPRLQDGQARGRGTEPVVRLADLCTVTAAFHSVMAPYASHVGTRSLSRCSGSAARTPAAAATRAAHRCAVSRRIRDRLSGQLPLPRRR